MNKQEKEPLELERRLRGIREETQKGGWSEGREKGKEKHKEVKTTLNE